MMKESILFIKKQIGQIYKGGLGVFFLKLKRMAKLLLLNIFAPLAVYFGLDWPEAEFFMGIRSWKRYKRASSTDIVDQAVIKRMQKKVAASFKKYIERKPNLLELHNWMDANRALESIHWHQSEVSECLKIQRNVEETRRAVIGFHQLDRLNTMFIPRAVAVGAIGHYEFLCVYIMEELLSGRPVKKKILLLPPGTPVINPAFLNYWRQYITVISDPLLIEFLAPLEKCLTVPLSLSLTLGGRVLPSHLSFGLIRSRWEKEKRQPLVALTEEDTDRGWKCLESLGVPWGAWFVCLHVRSPGWRDNGSWFEGHRNADINTYLPAIESIVEAGGWVIRMGDPGMKPLPPMPGVIDYAHSSAKSDWMDVFLCAKCKFFIGTSSGLSSWPILFGVPAAYTNILPPFGIYSFTSRDLFLPKLLWSKEEERYLNFKEFFTPPVGMGASANAFKLLNLEMKSNEPEDIKNLVLEMLARCDKTISYSKEDEFFQQCFKSIAGSCGNLYGDDQITVHARIGNDFLRKYTALLQPGSNEPLGVTHD